MINDIMDLSKAEVDKLSLTKTWFNIRGLLTEVMDSIECSAQIKRIILIMDVK